MGYGYIDPSSLYDANNRPNVVYKYQAIDKAREWMDASGIMIITPTETLDQLEEIWGEFKSMNYAFRKYSDDVSKLYFGITNKDHYEFLKSQFLSRFTDLENYQSIMAECAQMPMPKMGFYKRHLNMMIEKNYPAIYVANAILNIRKNCSGIYEDSVLSSITTQICDIYDHSCLGYQPNIYSNDLSPFTPEELENQGIFNSNPELNCFGVEGDNSIIDEYTRKQWFESYKSSWNVYRSMPSENAIERINWIRSLYNGIDQLSESKQKARKQSILELGWNPNLQFDSTTRNNVDKIMKEVAKTTIDKVDFIDCRGIATPDKVSISESSKASIKPIYVLCSYKDNDVDFVGFSFSPNFNSVYSFTKTKSGRLKASKVFISNTTKKHSIFVTAIFVKEKIYKTIKDRLDNIASNFNKYAYKFDLMKEAIAEFINDKFKLIYMSVRSLFGSLNMDIKSQEQDFVDATDTKNTKFSNSKIFILYDGPFKKYDSRKTDRLVTKISKNSTKEVAIHEASNTIINESGDIIVESLCEAYRYRDNITNRAYNSLIAPLAEILHIDDRIITSEGFNIIESEEFNSILQEASKKDKVPFFIVLTSGKMPWSYAISLITQTPFSHASVAFDRNLKTMYSFFSGTGKKNTKVNGFGKETIDLLKKNDINIGVFCIFVTKSIIGRLHNLIDKFSRNVSKTSYYIGGLVRYLFNLPKEYDYKLICSQFCDRILKAVGVDLTKKKSALVSPGDFERAAKNGDNIYQIFTGRARDYKPGNASKIIDKLANKKETHTFGEMCDIMYLQK